MHSLVKICWPPYILYGGQTTNTKYDCHLTGFIASKYMVRDVNTLKQNDILYHVIVNPLDPEKRFPFLIILITFDVVFLHSQCTLLFHKRDMVAIRMCGHITARFWN